MGSLISGILAELKLRKLGEITKIKFKNRIKILLKYIGDIFAKLEKNTDETRILEKLNTTDNIKFTLEVENSNAINYLDVKITKKIFNLETTIYRELNSRREIINVRCKNPYNYKIASLRSYINSQKYLKMN